MVVEIVEGKTTFAEASHSLDLSTRAGSTSNDRKARGPAKAAPRCGASLGGLCTVKSGTKHYVPIQVI